MQQPSSDQQQQIQNPIQFTNQQHLQQQPVVICPVQFVYHDGRPDEQHVQPAQSFQNQTFLINVQNTPPWIQNRSSNQIVYMPQIQQMMTNNMQPYITQNMVQNPMYIQQFQPMMMQDQRAMQIPNLIQQNMMQNQIRLQERSQEKMPLLTQMLQNQAVRKSHQTQNEIVQMQRPQFVNMRPQMITVNPMPNQYAHKVAIPSNSQNMSQIANVGQVSNVIPNASQASATTANIPRPVNAQSAATQTSNNLPIATQIPSNLPIATQISSNLPIGTQNPHNFPTASQMLNNITTTQTPINSIQMASNLPTAHTQSIPTSQVPSNLAIATQVPNTQADALTHLNDVIAQVAAIPKARELAINQNEIPNYIKNQIPEGLSVKTVYRPASINIPMNMIRPGEYSTQYIAPSHPTTSGVQRPKKPANVRPYAPYKRKIQDDRHETDAQIKIYKPMQSAEEMNREKYPVRVAAVSQESNVRTQSSNTGTQVEEKLLRNTVFVQARGRISGERSTNVVDNVHSQNNQSQNINQIDNRINKVDRSTQNDYRMNRIDNVNRMGNISNQIGNSDRQIGNSNHQIGNSNHQIGNSNKPISNSNNQIGNSNHQIGNSNNPISNTSNLRLDNSSNRIENNSNRIENSNLIGNSNNQINKSNLHNSNQMEHENNQLDARNNQADFRNNQVDIRNNQIDSNISQIDNRSNHIDNRSNQIDSRIDQNNTNVTQIENKISASDTKHIELPKVEDDIEMKSEDRDSPAQVVPERDIPEEIKDISTESTKDKPENDTKSINDEDDEKLSDLRKKIMINGNVYLKQRNTVEKFILTHVLDGHVIQESNLPFMIHKPMRSSPNNPTNNIRESSPSKTDIASSNIKQETVKEETIKEETEKPIKKETFKTEESEVPSKSKEKSEETKEVAKIKEERDCDTSKVNEDDPFENVTRSKVKCWTVSDLSTHLLHHKWRETAQMLRDEEIDGESLLLVNKEQLLQVGISERHADVLSAFLERTQ